ncbi:TPA: hypothetical protein ACUT68_001076 [Pseudomonas aeruginosa]
MSNEDWNELDESYRSALSGALETAHPAVEQAGGDERAAFEVWASALGWKLSPDQNNCGIVVAERYGHPGVQRCWEAWQARAALAQPSPAQAEAERPEVVARVVHSNPIVLGQCGPLNANDELMTVAQHAASVARWAEMFNRVEQQRDAALARVAELERQEPVATVAKVPGEDWNSLDFHRDLQDMQPGTKLYAAPVAQAQQLNDLDKQCRDDVARALGLRPNQERGFAWSYLLASIKSCVKASGDSAQAQHSVPEGWKLVPVEPLLNMMSDKDHDTRITAERQLLSILADAPGNLVPQAWLDVQAERRRQITAEGWTPEHDDEHDSGELAAAGAAYALHAADHLNPYSQGDGGDEAPSCWPWHDGIAGRGEGPEKTEPAWWKPSTPRRDLVKACALALAEIERLDRAAPGKEVGHE